MNRTTATVLRAAGMLGMLAAFTACTPGVDPEVSTDVAAVPSATTSAAAAGSSPTPSLAAAAPDSSRAVYCGSITAVDSAAGRVTLEADMSYRLAGDIHDARPENAAFTVPVTDDVTVLEFTKPKGTDVRTTGTLKKRLDAVQRLADGPRRPYLAINETGQVTRISFGVNTGDPAMAECFDGR